MTDLDKRLQEIAAKNWEQFVSLVGEDSLIAAKTCLLRQGGKSYAQIAIRLEITERQARTRCDNCEVKS